MDHPEMTPENSTEFSSNNSATSAAIHQEVGAESNVADFKILPKLPTTIKQNEQRVWEKQQLTNSSVTVLQAQDPNRVAEDFFGHKRRACATVRCQDWTFIVLSFLTLGTVLGLTIDRLIHYAEQPGTDFTLALVLLANIFFCMHYVISGIMRERLYEMCMYIGGTIIVVGYCIIDYTFNVEQRTIIKLVRLIIACALGPVNICLACLVMRTFGWLEFRVVGASETLQIMFRQRSLFYSLQTFDLQATTSFVILALSEVGFSTHLRTQDIVVSCCFLAFNAFWIYLGWFGVKREMKPVCIVFVVLSLVMPAFVIYHVVQITKQVNWYTYSLSFITLIGGEIVCVLRIGLLVCLKKVWNNFDHNLREHVFNFDDARYSILTMKDICCCCC